MKIMYLSDHIGFAEDVAKWIYDEFIHNIRNGLDYEQILTSVKECGKTELPIRLIAVADEKCVGTVSIVRNDLKCRAYTPWLAALYVDKPYRNNKIGEQLIERVKGIVQDLGYCELYLRTEHASGYYKKMGWQWVESCTDEFGLEPDVFKLTLLHNGDGLPLLRADKPGLELPG